MPTSCARRISVRDSGHSWAWISPPRHCSAAAEMTPWDEPPMPTARWSLVPRMATSTVAVMSPSAITLMRAPASRISAIRSSWRGRSSTTAVMSATLRPNASATASRFSETLRLRSITPFATGPTTIFFMYMRGTGIMLSGLAGGDDRERADAAAGDHRRPLDRIERQVEPAAAAAKLDALGRAGAPRRCGRSRSGRDSGISSSASAIATLAASSAARPSPRPR